MKFRKHKQFPTQLRPCLATKLTANKTFGSKNTSGNTRWRIVATNPIFVPATNSQSGSRQPLALPRKTSLDRCSFFFFWFASSTWNCRNLGARVLPRFNGGFTTVLVTEQDKPHRDKILTSAARHHLRLHKQVSNALLLLWLFCLHIETVVLSSVRPNRPSKRNFEYTQLGCCAVLGLRGTLRKYRHHQQPERHQNVPW